jgi:hypothetical protein
MRKEKYGKLNMYPYHGTSELSSLEPSPKWSQAPPLPH